MTWTWTSYTHGRHGNTFCIIALCEENPPIIGGFYRRKNSIAELWPFLSCLPTLRWRHNERDGVSNHQPDDCLLNRLFRRRSKKTSKFRVAGFVRGIHPWPVNSLPQRARDAANASIWWRHHEQANAQESSRCIAGDLRHHDAHLTSLLSFPQVGTSLGNNNHL